MFKKTKLLAVVVFSMFCLTTNAQNLVIETYNDGIVYESLESVQTIKFPSHNLSINTSGNQSTSLSILAVKKMYFGEVPTDVQSFETDVFIYPNPVSDVFRVCNLKNENSELELFTVHGVKIYQTSVTESNNEIDVSRLIPGIYLVKIGDSVFKFIKL